MALPPKIAQALDRIYKIVEKKGSSIMPICQPTPHLSFLVPATITGLSLRKAFNVF